MSDRRFTAVVRPQGSIAVLELHGEIAGSADQALSEAYTQAEALAPRAILLNFAGVDYINSTGIALIVGLLARSRAARVPLRVCGLSEHYQNIFNITRLADFMQIFADEATALSTDSQPQV